MEKRLERLEDKIDSVKEDVYDVKAEITSVKTELTTHIGMIEEHVAGDKKIIDQLTPILADLAEMVRDYKVTKIEENILEEQAKEHTKIRNQKLKNTSIRVAIVSGILAAVLTTLKILEVI